MLTSIAAHPNDETLLRPVPRRAPKGTTTAVDAALTLAERAAEASARREIHSEGHDRPVGGIDDATRRAATQEDVLAIPRQPHPINNELSEI